MELCRKFLIMQGGLHASLTELLSKWAPLNERAQIVSTAMAGWLSKKLAFYVNTFYNTHKT
jgi:hypothetical protein